MSAPPPTAVQALPSVPMRNYGLAVLMAAVTLALLLWFTPRFAGLNLVTTDRIIVMEPGEQHQARHPASANWALEFSDQFRFASETVKQRAVQVSARDVSPEERQWHFQLSNAEAARGDLALLLPNASGTLTFHINGAVVANGRKLPIYAGPGIGGSLLAAPIPAADLYSGLNRIDILQSEDRSRIGVRAIYLGPAANVEAAANGFTTWIEAQRLLSVAAAMAGLIGAVLLTLVGRQQVPAAAFGLLAFSQIAVFLPPDGLSAGVAASIATVAGASGIIWCRQHPHDWIGWLLLGLAVPALLGGITGFVLVGVDMLPPYPAGWLQIANNGARPLLLIGAPVSIFRDGSILFDRLRTLRAESERKDRTIEQQQAALEAKVRQAAVHEERQRFARDMHDGIGGHLQGLLMRVRAQRIDSGAIADELQSGLAELRLMVDSLDHAEASLFAALESFRIRAAPQLEASDIVLNWRLDEDLRTVALDPRATLSVYRILQELVSNCLRHSSAHALSIASQREEGSDRLVISVADDGRGFDPDSVPKGRGIGNIRARIERMGGTFELSSGAGGTRVRFNLPTAAAQS